MQSAIVCIYTYRVATIVYVYLYPLPSAVLSL